MTENDRRPASFFLPLFIISALLILLFSIGAAAFSVRQTAAVSRDPSYSAGSPEKEAGKTASDITAAVNENSDVTAALEETDTGTKAAAPFDSDSELSENNAATEAAEETESSSFEEETTEGETIDPSDYSAVFEAKMASIRSLLTENPNALTASNPEFESIRLSVKKLNTDTLSEEQLQLFQTLTDYLDLQETAFAYKEGNPGPGQRLCDVEGGSSYYAFLLRLYSGTDLSESSTRELIARELNVNHANADAAAAANPAVRSTFEKLKRDTAERVYQYTTMTAQSDPIKLAAAPGAFNLGWTEYAIIASYASDYTLDYYTQQYMISIHRMTTAMYALADISVHWGGWTEDDVIKTVIDYFGYGYNDLAHSLYQIIIDNPGMLSSACIDYLQIVQLESDLTSRVPNYSFDVLCDFLFDRGPANFHRYNLWLEELYPLPAADTNA